MMSVPPTGRKKANQRPARPGLVVSVLALTVLGFGAAGCSGMLDLPDDPYLAQPVRPSLDGGLPPSASPVMAPTRSESGVDTVPSSEVGGGNVQGNVPGNPLGQVMNAGENDLPSPSERTDAGALSPPPDAAPAPTCPAQATRGSDDRCYSTVASSLTWALARAECQALGAGWDLAAIQSAAENELVTELMSDEAWLGGSDAAVEGNWLWVQDEQPFWSGDGTTGVVVGGAFENWNSDEPNGGGPSDCLRLVPGLGTWADLQCTFERRAVCEGPAR